MKSRFGIVPPLASSTCARVAPLRTVLNCVARHELLDRDAGVDVDRDAEVVRRALARPQITHRGAGSGSSRPGARTRDRTGSAPVPGCTRPDYRRKHERVPAVLVRERVKVADVTSIACRARYSRPSARRCSAGAASTGSLDSPARERRGRSAPPPLSPARCRGSALADRHHELADGRLLRQRERYTASIFSSYGFSNCCFTSTVPT